jgi:hypothetical protein
MPAEAVHLSALADSITRACADVRLATGAGDDEELRELARLGAVLIDLAYFDRFAFGVLRYLLGRPLATSPVGDRLHREGPVRLGKLLLRRATALRAVAATRRDGERLLSLALGWFSHVAVDSRLHPLVNRLAAERATRLADNPARQHNEVEKFHSILFHEERFGFDFMGDSRLIEYIKVDARPIRDGGPLDRAYRDAIAAVHGTRLDDATLLRWTRGYAQYAALLGGWFGTRIMPAEVKEKVRGEVYEAPWGRFRDHYADAVERSTRYLEAALEWCDRADEAVFDRCIPDGSLDDPPYAVDSERGLGL